MSRLALGTVQFGLPYGIANRTGQVTRSEAKNMLRVAAANGVTVLDTAIGYGESETCLGEIGTSNFSVVTKLPAVPDGCDDVSGWINGQIDASLARLGVTSIYGLLLHRPQQLFESNGQAIFNALRDLKEGGRLQKIGVSVYTPDELEAVIARYRFDIVQAPFNLIDQRLHISGWLKRLQDMSIETHTRSAFLQGLLLMPEAAIPEKFAPWSGLWRKWHDWLSQHKLSAVEACLAFPLSFPEIDCVVVGADSANQLEQIVGAANSVITATFPDLYCDAENLINPARWSLL